MSLHTFSRKGNRKTHGEDLFELYLRKQSIPFEHEPSLGNVTSKLVDYVVPHKDGPVYLEVKDIESRPSSGGAFDPYSPIRSEIREGMKKFRALKGQRNALILVAAPASFVMLDAPHVIARSDVWERWIPGTVRPRDGSL